MNKMSVTYDLTRKIDSNILEDVTKSINGILEIYKALTKGKELKLLNITINNDNNTVIAEFEGENLELFLNFCKNIIENIKKQKPTFWQRIKAFFRGKK